MINLEDYRNDKNFNLDSVAFVEMFENIKDGLAIAISEYKNANIESNQILINEKNCFRRSAFGADKDLYTKVKLDIYVKRIDSFMVIFNPFEIYLAEYDGSENRYRSENLNNALVDMMLKLFPNSDYLLKREKYFKDSEIVKNVTLI